MKMIKNMITVFVLFGSLLLATDTYLPDNTKLPDLQMKDTNLTFKMIEGYQNYKVIATHFRTDKNEIRYILANPVAFNALKNNTKIMPEGSKIVKIGWSVKKMSLYNAALEADKIQRVEYMVKDSQNFNANGDHWGYARFINKEGTYTSWTGDVHACVSCHAVAKENDFLFTKRQTLY